MALASFMHWENTMSNRFRLLVVLLGCFLATAFAGEPESKTGYRFYKYEINVGYSNYDWTHIYVHQQVTWPNLPIFWKGRTRAAHGYIFQFQNNFFHTSQWFSLDWGVSAGNWISKVNRQSLSFGALFLAMRLWLIRTERFNFYFIYSAAGPAYMSASIIDNVDMYSRFTFQDFLGFGAFIGRERALNVAIKLYHYSNGLLVPKDPGFDVPIVFSLGYAFSA